MAANNDETFSTLTLQLHQQYVDLNHVIDSMGNEAVESVEDIAIHMKRIKETEAELKPLRDAVVAAGQKLPANLQTATDETIKIVTGLMPKLAMLEKATVESAKRLFPQVQESVRAVQMQNAYSGSRAS